MRFLILLLLSTTTITVVNATWTDISFPIEVLGPDLYTLMEFYEFGNKDLTAYIHWPKSVTFKVRYIPPTPNAMGHLKVDGDFGHTKNLLPSHSEGLYFIQNKAYVWSFFVKGSSGLSKISSKTVVHYSQPAIEESLPYLSIRYTSFEDVKNMAYSLYDTNKVYYDTYLQKYRATFMANVPGPEGLFLEYQYPSEKKHPQEGLSVRVLVGKVKGTNLKLTDNTDASQLIFDPKKNAFIVPEGHLLDSNPLNNVFGVRMMSTVFLAEMFNGGSRLLSHQDLFKKGFGKEMDLLDILEKALSVEPKYNCEPEQMNSLDTWPQYSPDTWPLSNRFQVMGFTFVKKANLENGKLSTSCPFLVESDDELDLYDKSLYKRLCMNDVILWPD